MGKKKTVITVGHMHTCPMCSGTVPHVGGPVIQSSAPGATINGKPIALMGDLCSCVGPPDVIAQGVAGVTINDIPIAVDDSMLAHGGSFVKGIPGATLEVKTGKMELATLPKSKIPTPQITTTDRTLAALSGNSKSLAEAETNQEELLAKATENEDEQEDLEKELPKLQGEIIFVNGYHSESLGGVLNAVFDLDPDDPSHHRGQNVSEDDHISEEDMLTATELDAINAMTPAEHEADRKDKAVKVKHPNIKWEDAEVPFPVITSPGLPPILPIKIKIPRVVQDTAYVDIPATAKPIPLFTKAERKALFWGYWNKPGNGYQASATYAKYFNAEGHEHFFNGSHGLGSNGAHRMDHGIAMGYNWARNYWGVMPKKEVDKQKEETPYIESYSPAYKPVTIVMHSQGNAPGAGAALGILKYANEQGWEQVPLNLIFLGVHQPKNLWETEYENFMKAKTNYYQVNKDFWDGDPFSAFYKDDRNVHAKFSNALSELFSTKYHKLRNKRGIYEHLNAITNFEEIKKRAVQFTFANDRGDLVCRDGDIPTIDSACNPKPDSTLFSVEYFSSKDRVPAHYESEQHKELIELDQGGCLIVPGYSAIKRIHIIENKETDSEEDNYSKEFWDSYRQIAQDWGNAFAKFKRLKKEKKWDITHYMFPPMMQSYTAKMLPPNQAYRKMLYQYGRIQVADLYAHFSPVEFIHDIDLLQEGSFEDQLGSQSAWDRIQKLGEDRFYRVVYDKDQKKVQKMTEEQKRDKEKEYIKSAKGRERLSDTNIANTSYIKSVIKAFVEGDKEAEKDLYHEPAMSDAEKEAMAKLKQKLGTSAEKELQELKQVQQDNTRVDIPKIKLK